MENELKDEEFNKIEYILRNENIPVSFLDKAVRKHFENKKWIAEKFGLNRDNDWKVIMPLPAEMGNRQEIVNFIEVLEIISEGQYRILDLNFMWKKKNKIRITKIIGEFWELLSDYVKLGIAYPCARDKYVAFITWWVEGGVNPVPAIGEKSKARFLCAFGDYIANGREGVISIHPYDYFTLSGVNCGFTSCVKIGGEYFNTSLSYLQSNCAIPVYCFNQGDELMKKVGRAMCYVNDTALHIGRVYGSFQEPDLLLLRNWMHEKIGGEWVKRSGNGLPDGSWERDGSAYIDSGSGTYTYKKDNPNGADRFFFPEGVCLSCGKKATEENGGTCYDCRNEDSGRCCYSCDEYYDENDMYYVNDHYYCSSCFDENFFTCGNCSENIAFDNDSGTEVQCYNSHRARRFTQVLCENCLCNTWTCYECGKVFAESIEPIRDEECNNDYCGDCADEYISSCCDCGCLFSDELTEVGDGKYRCDECLESLEGKIEEGKAVAV